MLSHIVLALHAELKAILPESTCSHSLCLPLVPLPHAVRSTSCGGQYPIDRNVKPVYSARAA